MDETISLAAALSKRGAIPLVASKMALIKEVQTDGYWVQPSVLKFEHLRKELRGLLRFIEKDRRPTIESDFTDFIVNDPGVPQPVVASTNLEVYRKRVTEYLHKNRSHLTIHKLRTNQSITTAELKQLEQMLFEQGELGTHELFVKAYGEQPLGTFIRSIVGLEQAAVRDAFSKFINNPSLNAAQIRFMDMIIQYLATNGTIETEKLFEAPFTEVSDNGILGVFNDQQAREVVEVLEVIQKRALA
jgi:type I restriction enzyme R subunit